MSKLSLDIIPNPRSVIVREGSLILDGSWRIDSEFIPAEDELVEFFRSELGLNFKSTEVGNKEISIRRDPKTKFPQEGYRLEIDEEGIRINANTEIGAQRGLSTLKQLIYLNDNLALPFVEIQDWPAFSHRGLLLDCSRHFFEPEVVKKYIDLLALYKMNTLHWHLTEDQGWRIAIDKYPKLTEVGAYRTEADGSIYGGYYTKENIREIVAYAASKHIEVIPEVEMPGHSQAALAAYPHLSCAGGPIAVANDWGVFKEIYCAGNDSVFIFLEDVLTEVMELFPSRFIHIGGDEAPKSRWETCEKCQARMAREGLTDEAELQSYFIRRIQNFLHKNGREIIGWDEILEGGLTEGAVVQSWRGMNGGVEAVKHGNEAIMSPTSHAYLDYDLDAINVEKVYSFNPVPSGLTANEQKLIIGGECNMWTEHVPDEATLDKKVFPRLIAMAEVLWSDSTDRDFNEFIDRLQMHYPMLDEQKVRYGEESVPMSHTMILDSGRSFLKLLPYSDDINLLYQFHSSDSNSVVREYQKPLLIDRSGTVNIQAMRNDNPYGDSIDIPVAYHSALAAEVNYQDPYSQWYTAGGESGLVDGKLGTLNFRDGAWQGFQGHDLVCTLKLNSPTRVSTVTANFYQYSNSWIFIPSEMSVEVSPDGEAWNNFGIVQSDSDPKKRGKFIKALKVKSNNVDEVLFIRLNAKSIGQVPSWHEAAGSEAWIFIDEIIAK